MSDTSTISLRLPVKLIQRIDRSAAQAGMNRTEYVTSYLPETYDSSTEQQSAKQRNNAR